MKIGMLKIWTRIAVPIDFDGNYYTTKASRNIHIDDTISIWPLMHIGVLYIHICIYVYIYMLVIYICWLSLNNFMGQWLFHQDNAPVHNSILVTDYLTKMATMTVPHPPYSPDIAPCDFCLFPKLRGCRYGTIEEMKKAVTKVIDTLTQVFFHGALRKLLKRHNRCIATGGDYFEGD